MDEATGTKVEAAGREAEAYLADHSDEVEGWGTDEWTAFKEGAGEAFNAEMGDNGETLNALFPDEAGEDNAGGGGGGAFFAKRDGGGSGDATDAANGGTVDADEA